MVVFIAGMRVAFVVCVYRLKMAAEQLYDDDETIAKDVAMCELPQSDLQSCRSRPDGRESKERFTDERHRLTSDHRMNKSAAATSDDDSSLDIALRSGN